MTSLELIVRPFQTRDVTPPSRVMPPTVDLTDPIPVQVLTAGSEGGKTFQLQMYVNLDFNTEPEKVYTETKRETHVVRVTNPSDSSQFVDVEKVDKLFLSRPYNPLGTIGSPDGTQKGIELSTFVLTHGNT